MLNVNLSTAIPQELFGHLSQFLTSDEQDQLITCCHRIQTYLESYFKTFCCHRFPSFFAVLNDKTWRITSWIRVHQCLNAPTLVFTEPPRHLHDDWDDECIESLTTETRRWVVAKVRTPDGSEKSPHEPLPEIPSCNLLEVSCHTVTCYHLRNPWVHLSIGAVDISCTLDHHDWRPLLATKQEIKYL